MRRFLALAAILATVLSVSTGRAANIGPLSGPLIFNGNVFTYTAGVLGLVGSGAITLNAGASTGLTAPGAMSLGGTYTFAATTDTPRFAGLGLGGPAISANELSIYGATSGRINLAVPAIAGTNTLTLPAGTTDLSSTGPGVLQQSGSGAGLTVGTVANSLLANSSTTVNGVTCTLGSTCTVTASATAITVGTTTVGSGVSGDILYNNAGTLGNFALAGDCTLSAPNITCTKTNGVAFGTGATADSATTSTAGIAKLQQPERAIGWIAGVNPNNATIFIAANALTVQSIVGVPEVALGAVGTVDVYDAASGTLCSGGTKVTTSSFDANGVAGTNQSLLSAPYSLASGHRLCLQSTGVGWAGGASIAGITVAANPS